MFQRNVSEVKGDIPADTRNKTPKDEIKNSTDAPEVIIDSHDPVSPPAVTTDNHDPASSRAVTDHDPAVTTDDHVPVTTDNHDPAPPAAVTNVPEVTENPGLKRIQQGINTHQIALFNNIKSSAYMPQTLGDMQVLINSEIEYGENLSSALKILLRKSKDRTKFLKKNVKILEHNVCCLSI